MAPPRRFLVACTRLYTPLCRSVGRSVGQSVGRLVGRSVGRSLTRSALPSTLLPLPNPNTLCIRTCFYFFAFFLVKHLNEIADEGIWDNSTFLSALELTVYEQ